MTSENVPVPVLVAWVFAVLGLLAGAGWLIVGGDPADRTFDAQSYCVRQLGGLAVKYPKTLGGVDLEGECAKMLAQTGATSAKTVDALLATAETFYRPLG